MADMKTPGVYIKEKNAFPNSVVAVATAVPAFIGYTEKAMDGTTPLLNIPWRITSMAEFHNFFGGAPNLVFKVTPKNGTVPTAAPTMPPSPLEEKEETEITDGPTETPTAAPTSQPTGTDAPAANDAPGTPLKTASDKKAFEVVASDTDTYTIAYPADYYTLYYHMLLFFANGGGPCYIVSVGDYNTAIDKNKLSGGLNPLVKEQEPTLIVIPEAVNLKEDDCKDVQQAMLGHCGNMQNRFAILDVWNGIELDSQATVISNFRTKIGSNFLNYGAAYFPWLETSVLTDRDLSYTNLDWGIATEATTKTKTWPAPITSLIADYKTKIDQETDPAKKEALETEQFNILSQNFSVYKNVLAAIKQQLNLLPPSAAMAGIYTMIDNSRGVWKAPANVSVNNVNKPSANITNEQQDDLNMPLAGKAINAIRTFIGEGVKIWGARTLDGNSQDWRYINVRRTMIFLEESIKNAARAYVFEPNVAGTWINMKGMIDNFLKSVWKQGGLAGATPEDAFSVHVGLGDTMTPEDILDGILRITVLVAVTRPAEFIEITFQQQMQKS